MMCCTKNKIKFSVLKKSLAIIVLILIFSLKLNAQTNLTNYNTSWTTVLPGKVLCAPVETSFGFVVYSDAKTISAFSDKGKLLWEKSAGFLKDVKGLKIFGLKDDFLVVIKNDGQILQLLNPSGCEIWKKNLDFEINSVCSGRDGRIFLKGKDRLDCLGITGIRKWTMNLPEMSDLELKELPDGSFIVFLKELENDKTKGIRLSPFGELLEEITFSGKILSAFSEKNGIYLTFADGSAGFFSLSDDKKNCINKWVLNNNHEGSDEAFFALNKNNDSVLYVNPQKNKIQISLFDYSNGALTSGFEISSLNSKKIQKFNYSDSHFFICDDKTAVIYSDSGKEILKYNFQPQSKFKWNYLLYKKDDVLVFFGTNWSINAYKLDQTGDFVEKNHENYEQWLPATVNEYKFSFMTKLDSKIAGSQRILILKNGDYGNLEKEMASDLKEMLMAYSVSLNSFTGNSRQENSVFETDAEGTELMLKQLSVFGTSIFNNYESKFLKEINNKNLLLALLEGISQNGYDPDGQLLDSLSELSVKTSYKDEKIIEKICDCVYSICIFMGRPAFYSKGKTIISNFLYPKYNSSTRTYARECLKKITALDL